MTAAAADDVPEINTSNLPVLLEMFGVLPSTQLATDMGTTAFLCGSPALPGESRSCPISRIAVAQFVSEQLKVNVVEVLATRIGTVADAVPLDHEPIYTIVDFAVGSEEQGKRIIICHNVNFASQVYYCHSVTKTKVVLATLRLKANGSTIKASAVCQIDTMLWDSSHPAFAALWIPRGSEVCHFLVDNDVLFAPVFGVNAHVVQFLDGSLEI